MAAGKRCPACGAAIDEDAVICSACDHILDSSFLEEADGDPGDEDTDPRMALPPAMDEEEPTDPGLKNPEVIDSRLAAFGEPEDDGRTVTGAADTGHCRVPPRRHDSGSPSGTTDAGGGDGSALLDEYEKYFRDAWRSFHSLPAADKVLCCGLVLGFLAVFLPWRVLVFDNGLSSIRSGLSVGGWLNVLLAGASGTILYLRNWRGMGERMQLMLAQVGIAGAGLGWSAIAFLIGIRVAAAAPNFGEATAGPSYGVFVSMLAWGVVCAGAALTLMDGLVSSRHSGRGPPAPR